MASNPQFVSGIAGDLAPLERDAALRRHAVVTPNAVLWQANATLDGLSVWGRLDVDAVHAKLAAYDAQDRSRMSIPADSVIDASRLEGFDGAAFAAVISGILVRADNIRRRRRRAVVAAQPTHLGAAIVGLLPIARFGLPWQTCTSLAEAFALADAGAAAALEVLVREAITGSALLPKLRAWLVPHTATARTTTAARALGLSVRSLQRLLTAHGRSFLRSWSWRAGTRPSSFSGPST